MENKELKPWYASYGNARPHLNYFDGTIYELVKKTSEKYPNIVAYEFQGKNTTYKKFVSLIDKCAIALNKLGIKENDLVTIALPNCPQGLIMFYALNKIGAISNMIHPLSAEGEIKFFINFSKSKAIITLDQFFPKVKNILGECPTIDKVIIATIKEELPAYKKIPFALTLGRKLPKISKDEPKVLFFKDLMKMANGEPDVTFPKKSKDDTCSILYSGGTTGTNKGILLSNYNFNALSDQIIEMNQIFHPGDLFLSVMPIFHGFGLGIGIHTMLTQGGTCILVPRFNPQSYCKLVRKYRPNFIAGVPTLFAAMLKEPTFQKTNLSCFKGVFSGGDSLSVELKKKLDVFLKEHGANVRVREGFGMTECVTASCLTPITREKEGSIGIPLSDMVYSICEPGTDKELPYGEQGEICIAGPTVMKGYLNNKEETDITLKVHSDGLTYIHSGDIGYMDEDGYIYFVQRLKRMIVTSGYNVYPSQIENIIDHHPAVQMSCIIGVKDPIKMQKIKAFVTLKEGYTASDELRNEIREYLKKNVAKYMLPYEIEFRDALPKTLVGKIAYRKLEEEEEKKLANK